MTKLYLKRAYQPFSPGDGRRVYIDRLWPRGLSHETFRYDVWDKDIAPSDALRHWFHDNPDARWEEFEEKYRSELESNPAWPSFVKSIAAFPVVTLLYSSRNETENNAVTVAEDLVAEFPAEFEMG